MQLSEIVTDSANIFTPNQLFELQQKLTDFEVQTTNQLVVVSIE
nr:TPM domain-containing protein [Maribacter antarcticus]